MRARISLREALNHLPGVQIGIKHLSPCTGQWCISETPAQNGKVQHQSQGTLWQETWLQGGGSRPSLRPGDDLRGHARSTWDPFQSEESRDKRGDSGLRSLDGAQGATKGDFTSALDGLINAPDEGSQRDSNLPRGQLSKEQTADLETGAGPVGYPVSRGATAGVPKGQEAAGTRRHAAQQLALRGGTHDVQKANAMFQRSQFDGGESGPQDATSTLQDNERAAASGDEGDGAEAFEVEERSAGHQKARFRPGNHPERSSVGLENAALQETKGRAARGVGQTGVRHEYDTSFSKSAAKSMGWERSVGLGGRLAGSGPVKDVRPVPRGLPTASLTEDEAGAQSGAVQRERAVQPKLVRAGEEGNAVPDLARHAQEAHPSESASRKQTERQRDDVVQQVEKVQPSVSLPSEEAEAQQLSSYDVVRQAQGGHPLLSTYQDGLPRHSDEVQEGRLESVGPEGEEHVDPAREQHVQDAELHKQHEREYIKAMQALLLKVVDEGIAQAREGKRTPVLGRAEHNPQSILQSAREGSRVEASEDPAGEAREEMHVGPWGDVFEEEHPGAHQEAAWDVPQEKYVGSTGREGRDAVSEPHPEPEEAAATHGLTAGVALHSSTAGGGPDSGTGALHARSSTSWDPIAEVATEDNPDSGTRGDLPYSSTGGGSLGSVSGRAIGHISTARNAPYRNPGGDRRSGSSSTHSPDEETVGDTLPSGTVRDTPDEDTVGDNLPTGTLRDTMEEVNAGAAVPFGTLRDTPDEDTVGDTLPSGILRDTPDEVTAGDTLPSGTLRDSPDEGTSAQGETQGDGAVTEQGPITPDAGALEEGPPGGSLEGGVGTQGLSTGLLQLPPEFQPLEEETAGEKPSEIPPLDSVWADPDKWEAPRKADQRGRKNFYSRAAAVAAILEEAEHGMAERVT